jgi:hypothetical protein
MGSSDRHARRQPRKPGDGALLDERPAEGDPKEIVRYRVSPWDPGVESSAPSGLGGVVVGFRAGLPFEFANESDVGEDFERGYMGQVYAELGGAAGLDERGGL